MKKEKGLTIIALVIIIVAVGIIIFAGLQYAEKYINKQEVEDTKATMLAIQTVITNIQNKHIVDEENNLLEGVNLDLENNTTGYNISEKLKESLQTQENANLYILNKEELQEHGINDVEINETKFFIVDYNSGEIFYSLGVDGKYKLRRKNERKRNRKINKIKRV